MKLILSRKRVSTVVLSALMAGLLACSSPAEKAQRFYDKGKALMQEGNLSKANLEFRNALQINANMIPAWLALADIAERKGDWEQMFRNLTKVVELDAKNIEAQVKLGRLLMAAGQLDKALPIGEALKTLAPDDPSALALRASMLYKLEDRKGAVALANAALTKDAVSIDALVVLASERIAANDPEKAIVFLDRGLKQDEKNAVLQFLKIQALEKLARLDLAEGIYRKLIGFYPNDRAYRHVLAQFYLAHGQKDKAEAEYRAVAAAYSKDVQAQLDVVRFVNDSRGKKAALGELQGLLKADPDNPELLFALAAFHQGLGERSSADEVFRSIIAKQGDKPEGLRAKGLLAASLLAARERAAGEALIAEILTKDARNEQALLLRAGLEIEERRLDDAIANLRTILRDSPSSTQALLLLGQAHELAGSRDLADDQYLRAFQASKLAAPVGLAYANFLMKGGRAKQAEGILKDVLRTTPGDVPALKMLAQVYLVSGNLAGAQALVEETRKIKGQAGLADQIQGAVFVAKKNYESSISSFRRAYEASPSEVQPMVALLRTYLRAGKTKEALSFMESVVQATPNNVEAQILHGQLEASAGSREKAARIFRQVIERDPKNPAAYLQLASLLAGERKLAEAGKVVDDGLAAIPEHFELRMTKASLLEGDGKIDAAIALYEAMLKERPGTEVVVNNLASLLSEFKQDKENLKRAYDLASRLKNTEIPLFKDTVGWASYKVGKYEEAARLLADAAKQQPGMGVVRYHAGMAQLALSNKEAARKELEQAIELAGKQSFPQAEEAKKALQGL